LSVTPLEGITVLDLTEYVAGPYCTKLLAAFGAEVIKIERPKVGDPMRHIGPFAYDSPNIEGSLAFLDLNVNKKSITLNLNTKTGKSIFYELLKGAHLVVDSHKPGFLEARGLSYDELSYAKPSIVLTTITNFGYTGPYRDIRASEIVLYAMGHEMYGTGKAYDTPLSMAPRLNLYFAGLTAAVGTCAALYGALEDGVGDWLDISIMECFMASIDRRADSLVAYAYCGEKMQRERMEDENQFPPPYTRCADGYVHISLGTRESWRRLAKALGDEFPFSSQETLPPTSEEAQKRFLGFWANWCSQRTKRSIVALLQATGIPCAPVNSVADLVADEHLKERGYFVRLDHRYVGSQLYTGLPIQFEKTPGKLVRGAPCLGEHNSEVYGELGFSDADLNRLVSLGII